MTSIIKILPPCPSVYCQDVQIVVGVDRDLFALRFLVSFDRGQLLRCQFQHIVLAVFPQRHGTRADQQATMSARRLHPARQSVSFGS